MSVKRYVSLFVPAEMYDDLNTLCAKTSVSKSKVGRDAMEMYLNMSSESKAWFEVDPICWTVQRLC